jgi:pathogenesis-related protein 1
MSRQRLSSISGVIVGVSAEMHRRHPLMAVKPNHCHIRSVNGVAMRPMLALLVLFAVNPAQAQYPSGDWRYAPGYPPTGGYTPRAEARLPLAQAMLQAHNVVRSHVRVPPLVWSENLAKFAQDWANHLIATHGFSHRPNNRYGENLYMIAGATAPPPEVVGSWASEAREYDLRSNTCSGVCGHYTQIVWAETRAMGCAFAADRQQQVWVCNYDPPGNVVGYRPY